MRRFIQELGVLTGNDQNDLFFCRNPNMPAEPTDFDLVMDVESLSDAESPHMKHDRTSDARDNHTVHTRDVDAHVLESLEVSERSRKLSSSGKDSTHEKSIRKSLKKKVSFDKGKSYSLIEAAKEEVNPGPRQKRSLPRQEIAVDLESPISSKKLAEDYPVLAVASGGMLSIDGQNVTVAPSDASGESQEKKRKVGKYRKFSAGRDSSQSTEMSSFSEISQEGSDQIQENASLIVGSDASAPQISYLSEGNMGMRLTVPNLFVKTTALEKPSSSVYNISSKKMVAKYDREEADSGNTVTLQLPEGLSGKPNSCSSEIKDSLRDSSAMSTDDILGDDGSPKVKDDVKYLHESNDTRSPRDSSEAMLLPANDNKKNKGALRSFVDVDDSARWSCSGLDRSKETSL